MTNVVCNAVTHVVSNEVRRSVQNQNQNQTVVRRFFGLSVAKKSIHRYCSRGPANTTPGTALGTARVVSASVMDGHDVAIDGGVR